MKRFKTINFFGSEIVEYTPKKKVFDPYQADDSKFSPMNSALSRLSGQPLSDKEIAQSYDFVDGVVPSNFDVPLGRSNYGDITEIAKAVKDGNSQVRKVLDKAKRQAEFDANLEKVSNPQSSVNNSNSNSSSTN